MKAEIVRELFEMAEDIKRGYEQEKYKFKYDQNKLRLDLIPPEIIEALGEIFTYGYKKYAEPKGLKESNWRKVEPERYEAAMIRHYLAWKKGENTDPESGYHHLKHMLWNAGVLVCLCVHQNSKSVTQKCESVSEDLEVVHHVECDCPNCKCSRG